MTPRSVHEYAAALWPVYRMATREKKGRLLDQAQRVTGYHRKSLIRVLGRVERPPRRRSGRPPRYGAEGRRHVDGSGLRLVTLRRDRTRWFGSCLTP